MAVTAEASGTQTATIGTEHTLADVSSAGTFQLEVDTNALADGDVLELRVYKKILAGGTLRVIAVQQYFGAQPDDDKVKVSDPHGNDLTTEAGLRFTLKQTAGTGRSFPWKILKYA